MSTSTEACSSFQMPPPSPEHAETQRVADRLVELCSAGQNLEAIRELYAEDSRHVEVMGGPGCPRIVEGKANVLDKAEQFARNTTIHSASCGKPVVNGDMFLCPMSIDCTAAEGPMAGHRMTMDETALYTVRDGKITEARFFYACGG